MEALLACLEENSLPLPPAILLWLSAAGLLLAVLAAFYGFVLAGRNLDWLEGGYRLLEAYLSRRVPRFWVFLKSRFSRTELLGLELTVSASLIVLLIVLFAEITESWADRETLFRIDQATHCVLAGFLTGGMLQAFRFITHFADVLTLVVLSAVVLAFLLWRRRLWQAMALFLATAAGQGLLWGMKWFFARPRPDQQLMEAVGQSFPSGHSFSAMVFYGFLLFLLWQFCASKALRLLGSLALALLILTIAVSRLLLSVHWVSDVVGGLVIGLAWLLASLLLSRAWFVWKGRL